MSTRSDSIFGILKVLYWSSFLPPKRRCGSTKCPSAHGTWISCKRPYLSRRSKRNRYPQALRNPETRPRRPSAEVPNEVDGPPRMQSARRVSCTEVSEW